MVEILQLLCEISSFSEALYKRGVLKHFLKFSKKHKKQSPGGVKRCYQKKHLCRSLLFNKIGDLNWQSCSLKLAETATGDSLWNNLFLKFSEFCRKKYVLESLFHKVGVLRACNFIKEDSDTGVFLSNLQTFLEQLSWRTSVRVCF